MSLKHRLESVAIRLLMGLFSLLPVDTASAIGGAIGRALGPMTGIHRKARRQMLDILCDTPPATIDQYLADMWDNLGRTMAEYPHLEYIAANRVTYENQAGLTQEKLDPTAAIFISGHFANWEVAGPALLHYYHTPLDLLYRAANNRGVDGILARYRSLNGKLSSFPKSRTGMRALVDALKHNRKIGILIDQKYNEGIVADFFGKPAMASAVYAQLGQKFNCPVYPAQVVRTHGAHFHITLYPALSLWENDGTTPRAVADIVAETHALLYSWMRAHPAQWLWVHQRWSSKGLKSG